MPARRGRPFIICSRDVFTLYFAQRYFSLLHFISAYTILSSILTRTKRTTLLVCHYSASAVFIPNLQGFTSLCLSKYKHRRGEHDFCQITKVTTVDSHITNVSITFKFNMFDIWQLSHKWHLSNLFDIYSLKTHFQNLWQIYRMDVSRGEKQNNLRKFQKKK